MYKFNKIVVGLDLSEMDEQLISAVCAICKISGSKQIYFMNVIRDFNFPEELLKEFPDILDKALKERKDIIEKKLADNFECTGVTTHIIIKQGQPTKEIMKFTNQEKIDLVVVGQKIKKQASGVIVTRLARRLSCSLLIIPKDTEFKLERLLIPIDFSSYSKMALQKALAIYRNATLKPKLFVQNVYQVPSGYHYTGKTFEEFSEIMQSNAHRDYAAFTSDVKFKNIPLEVIYTLDKNDNVIEYIYKEAKKLKSDLIIIGAKGRTTATSLFIGTKAERLVQLDTDIAILVIRPKGKSAGLIEFIKEL